MLIHKYKPETNEVIFYSKDSKIKIEVVGKVSHNDCDKFSYQTILFHIGVYTGNEVNFFRTISFSTMIPFDEHTKEAMKNLRIAEFKKQIDNQSKLKDWQKAEINEIIKTKIEYYFEEGEIN